MSINSQSSQKFVPIKEVRDGIIILKDNSMRMLMMTSTINFGLKSEDEQAAILVQFQNFLNSIEFSTQIYIQSRRLDIKPYLALLDARLQENVSELMRIQIQEYIEFIRNFTDTTAIMTKNFFVVIPYSPAPVSLGKKKSADKKKPGQDASVLSPERFDEGRIQLQQRANIVKQGLSRTGVRTTLIGTDEIVELFYRIFNPSDPGKRIT